MKHTITAVLAVGLVMVLAGAARAATTVFDMEADYLAAWPNTATAGAPGGIWGDTGTVGNSKWQALAVDYVANATTPMYSAPDSWRIYYMDGTANSNFPAWTEVDFNPNAGGLVNVYDNNHDQIGHWRPVLRWTSDVSGTITITGLGGGGSDGWGDCQVRIVKNGNFASPLWDSGLQGNGTRVSMGSVVVTVAPGDTLDFTSVNTGAGQWAGWNDVIATGDVLVPEPATMSLLAIGGLAALIRRRRA
ncbi:MAG: PEP-CTERM sorting domain-containing protein [Planctomycetaceae bacterium]|nr:PEP-CTERM sorting domain-containing protein [Planctomycetaceae bacterium]